MAPSHPSDDDLLDLPLGDRPDLSRPPRGLAEERAPVHRPEAPPSPGRRGAVRRSAPPHRGRSGRGDPPTLDRSGRSPRKWALVLVALLGIGAAAGWLLRPAPARLVAEPGVVDLGAGEIGVAAAPRELVLRNTGGRPTEIRRLDLLGGSSGEFEIVETDCPDRSLEPGGSCRLRVTGTPTERGVRTARLRLQAAGHADVEVGLQVAGAMPVLELSPRRLDFGSHPIGSVGLPADVEVANLGEAPARGLRIRRRGGSTDDFLVYRDQCSGEDLPAGKSCTVRFGFRPVAAGERETTLLVEADGAGPPLEGLLSGIGARRPVRLELRPARVDLGGLEVGGSSEAVAVEVVNRGEGDADEITARIEPAEAPFTVATGTCRGKLRPGSRCRLEVTFRPRAAGAAQGRLVVGGEGGAEAELAGQAWRAALAVTPGRLDFGTVAAGAALERGVELVSEGTGPVRPGSPTVEGDASAFRIDASACPGELAPGRSCRVEVVFRPEGEGASRARVRWPGVADVGLDLSGESREARLEVGSSRLDLGEVPAGRSAGLTAVVINRSGFAVRLPEARFVGSGTIRIEEDGCSSRELAPGARCGIRLVFAPTAPGPAGGELVLPAPAQDGKRRIPVSARGI